MRKPAGWDGRTPASCRAKSLTPRRMASNPVPPRRASVAPGAGSGSGFANKSKGLFAMGAISFSLDEKLLALLSRELPLKLFFETGTFQGESLRIARPFFPECHSVELS